MEHCFYAPTLFDNVPSANTLGHDEIFGPVAGVFRVNGFDGPIEALNGNRFGLSAGICTRPLLHAEEFKRRARAVMLLENIPTAGVARHTPCGATAASSHPQPAHGQAA